MGRLDARIDELEAEIAAYKTEYKTASSEDKKQLLQVIAACSQTLSLLWAEKARAAAGIRS
jgi:hypothetical protein